MARSYRPNTKSGRSLSARQIATKCRKYCEGACYTDSKEKQPPMHLLALQRALWVACIAAEVLLVGAVFHRRLIRRYALFTSYLALDAFGGTLLIQVNYHSPTYAYAF